MIRPIFFILFFFIAQLSFGQNLKVLIDHFAVENDFNGTVLVNKKDEIIYLNSFGLANRENKLANHNHMNYAVASITKVFTSVIILQLVDEGRIDLNKTIGYYLPKYNEAVGNKVTIHHLLTHTSGMQNCEKVKSKNNELPDIYIDDCTIDEIIKKYCSGPIINPTGTTFDYNNGDYIILGKIIEEILQSTFVDALKDRLLIPLEMKNTGLIIHSEEIQNLAIPYKWDVEMNLYKKDPFRRIQNYYSSGALYSCAEDLIRFSKALFDGKLISAESIQLLIRTYEETKGYGYGVWVSYPKYNKTVPKVVQRFGRIWGINTLISHFIDHDITIIVLANTNKVGVLEFQDIVGKELLK